MYELIDTLQQWYAGPGLVVLAVVLVLVDYFFPTDWPAHVGYFCFGAGMFFLFPWGLATSIVAALVVWGVLAFLHQVWFRKFLTNATQGREPAEEKNPSPSPSP